MERGNMVGTAAIILKTDPKYYVLIGRRIRLPKYYVLIGRRINSKAGNNMLSIPGGTLESGEPLYEGIKREVLEETGLTVVQAEPIGFSEEISTVHEHPRYITLYLECFIEKFQDLKTMEPDKCEEWFWYPVDQLHKIKLWQDSKNQIMNLVYGKAPLYEIS